MNAHIISQPWARYYPAGALDDLDAAGRRLTSLLDDAAALFADRTALSTPAFSWTFVQLSSEANKMAALFQQVEVTGGARVAILLPNMPEYVAAMFGAWLVGATVVQVNPAYTATEINRILEHSLPVVLVTTPGQISKLNTDGISLNCRVCLIEEDRPPSLEPVSQRDINPRRPDPPDQSEEVAVLQYTGGTTGLPKAVMLTHRNILSNIEQRLRLTFRAIDMPVNAKVVNTLPMCHVYGMTCVTLTSIAVGMHQLIVPRFQVRTVLELIKDAKPFAFFGVPTMYAAFLREQDLEAFGLEKVAVFNSAGAPMPPAQLAQFEARVGANVLDGFGMSEASPCTHTNPPFLPRRAGSSGIPVPFTEVRIVESDQDMVDVAQGGVGELAIRGPQVMRGYWRDPYLTARTVRGGWLLSGDLARVDQDGYLYIVGRLKEVIVASGYNIYPAEIECVIAQADGVAEVCVVGIPDEYRGETVKAVIVPVAGWTVDRAAVMERCRRELAPFKVPTVLEFLEELPRTAVGKIDKRRLVSVKPN